MKKIISMLLCVILVLSAVFFTSCDDEKTSKESREAYKAYTDALCKINALDSLEGKLNVNMTMNIDGTVQTTSYNFSMKATGIKNPESMKMRMNGSMYMAGQNIGMDVYLENDWIYYDMTAMGANMQYKANLNGESDGYSDLFEMGTVELPEALFKKVVVENNSDGSKSLSLTLSGSQLLSLYSDLSESIGEGAKPSDISDAKLTATVDKNGYISKVYMSYSMTVEGVRASAEFTVEYVNPGSPVTVTPMDGYESFPEQPAL